MKTGWKIFWGLVALSMILGTIRYIVALKNPDAVESIFFGDKKKEKNTDYE